MAGSDWKRVVTVAFDAFDSVTIEPATPLDDVPPGSADALDVVRASLEDPVELPPLRDMLATAERITIVVPDGMIHLSEDIVEAVLSHIAEHGRVDAEVVVLVATGWRQGPTGRAWEASPHLSAIVRSGLPIAVHETSHCVRRGIRGAWWVEHAGSDEVEVELNPLVTDVDLVILLDRIELSHDLGFAGGYTAVSWGCAGPSTLLDVETLCDRLAPRRVLPDADAVVIHDALAAISTGAAPVFGVFEATSRDGKAFVSGEPLRATRLMAGRPNSGFGYETERYDAAVLWVDEAFDTSLLRATEAYTILALQSEPPLHPGAPIVLVAACVEGVGCDASAAAFGRVLADASDASTAGSAEAADISGARFARRVRAASQVHPLYIVARPVGAQLPEGIHMFHSLEEAFASLQLHLRATAGTAPKVLVTRDVRRGLPRSPESRDAARSERQ